MCHTIHRPNTTQSVAYHHAVRPVLRHFLPGRGGDLGAVYHNTRNAWKKAPAAWLPAERRPACPGVLRDMSLLPCHILHDNVQGMEVTLSPRCDSFSRHVEHWSARVMTVLSSARHSVPRVACTSCTTIETIKVSWQLWENSLEVWE